MFRYPAFIVLDLPQTIAEQVTALRRVVDANFPPLPAEITVAGSSGVGPIMADQSQEFIFRTLDLLANRIAAIESAFGGIERFPGSPVAYLRLVDVAPFVTVHQTIRASDIRFVETPFPYLPHCTIRFHGAGTWTESESNRIMALPVPERPFLLKTLSVYELDGQKRECRHLHRCELSG